MLAEQPQPAPPGGVMKKGIRNTTSCCIRDLSQCCESFLVSFWLLEELYQTDRSQQNHPDVLHWTSIWQKVVYWNAKCGLKSQGQNEIHPLGWLTMTKLRPCRTYRSRKTKWWGLTNWIVVVDKQRKKDVVMDVASYSNMNKKEHIKGW